MTNLRLRLSHLTSKKVPALSLVLIATLGMVAGVLAATMVVTQYTNTGVGGSYRTNTGDFTVTDTGLAVVANAAASNLASGATFGISGTNVQANNVLTAGNWMEVIEFTTTLIGGSAHTATITIRNGTGPLGTILTTASISLTPPAAASTGKVTVYVDLATQSLTSPLTVYVSVA